MATPLEIPPGTADVVLPVPLSAQDGQPPDPPPAPIPLPLPDTGDLGT